MRQAWRRPVFPQLPPASAVHGRVRYCGLVWRAIDQCSPAVPGAGPDRFPPMRDMMRESVVSGVRIRSYEEVEQWRSQWFKERFFCDPATLTAYRKYMAACGALSGTVEAQI
jgi:hypothetical protein